MSELREKYARALSDNGCGCVIGGPPCHQCLTDADAVLVLRDAELEQARSTAKHYFEIARGLMAARDGAETEVERLTWERDHFERCFTEANASAADALRGESVLRARLAAVETLAVKHSKALRPNREDYQRQWSEVAALASVPAVDAGDRAPASEDEAIVRIATDRVDPGPWKVQP